MHSMDDSILADIGFGSAPTIRIGRFKKEFIPLILRDDPTEFNLLWISKIAGSPYQEVHVLGDTDNYLRFTLPALRVPQSSLEGELSNVMADVLSESQRKASIHGSLGEAVMAEYMPQLIRYDTIISISAVGEWRKAIIECGCEEKLLAFEAKHGIVPEVVETEEIKTSPQNSGVVQLEDDSW